MTILLLRLLLLGGILLMGCSCSEDRVPVNLTSEEVFDNPDARDLARAAARGNTARIDELLAKGVDINYAGKYGITPLWWSIVASNYAGFSHLLAKGADPNVEIEKTWGSVMEEAARTNDARFLQLALQHRGDPNLAMIESGRTPLISAILSDRTQNLRILIEAGADLDQLDAGGETAAHVAAAVRDYEKLSILLDHGADLTIRDNLGRNVRDILKVISERHPEAGEMLKRLPEGGDPVSEK